ncbi:hypothetical protein D3C76_1565490 [compost metagenome]
MLLYRNRPTKITSSTIQSGQHCTRFCAIHSCATRLKAVNAASSQGCAASVKLAMAAPRARLASAPAPRPNSKGWLGK